MNLIKMVQSELVGVYMCTFYVIKGRTQDYIAEVVMKKTVIVHYELDSFRYW